MKIMTNIGTMFSFDRLTKEIDNLGNKKDFEIFAQIGNSKYIPKNIKFVDFMTPDEFSKEAEKQDIIISHAGIGSIIELLNLNKRIILFPRLKKYGEAIDNHQLEICKAFNKKYGIEYTINEKELIRIIKKKKIIKKTKKDLTLFKEIKNLIN
jgi:UDP-N-acetylglucosamine transferase subunit ALG13